LNNVGVGGLFVSARAGHGIDHIGGLVAFLFCTGFVLYPIKSSFDHE